MQAPRSFCVLSLVGFAALIGCGDDDSADMLDGGVADVVSSDVGLDAPTDVGTPVDSSVDSAVLDVGTDAGEADGGPDASIPVGSPTWVIVGNWGYRATTTNGRDYSVIAGPVQDSDHTPDLLRGVGFGEGAFIAVGGDRNSMIMRTRDGVTWEEDLYPEGRDWMGDVAFGNGRWVAVGGNGRTAVSEDGGDTWREGAERLPRAGRRIAFLNGQFVAVGDGGMVATSSDGDTWSDQGQGGERGINQLAYGRGLYVVGSQNWNGSGFDIRCYTSPDAETWTECPFLADIDRLSNIALLGGDVVVTTNSGYELWDGSSWNHDETELPSAVLGAESEYVGAQGTRRYYGADWRAMEQVSEAERGLRDMAFGHL
ncbi:MAG: WD40/YVTN/BNR-like repeat-containing protein [Polyangiales bacterium]